MPVNEYLRCPDCGAPLKIDTEDMGGWNGWVVRCSVSYEHGPEIYDWPSEGVVIPLANE